MAENKLDWEEPTRCARFVYGVELLLPLIHTQGRAFHTCLRTCCCSVAYFASHSGRTELGLFACALFVCASILTLWR